MGRPRIYHISLTEKERDFLNNVKRKTESHTVFSRCKVLLEADEGRFKQRSTQKIAAKSGVTPATVSAVLKLFVEGGVSNVITLKRNPNSDVSRLKVTGEVEAKIIAKASIISIFI